MPGQITITINPSSVHVPEGKSYHGSITVTNDSHVPLTVKPLVLSLGNSHSCTQSVPWLHVATGGFKLAPLAAHDITYTVSGTGNGTAAVVAEASAPPKQAGHISGAVGTKIVLGTGTQACTAPKAQTPVHAASAGPPWWLFIVIAVAVLALAFVVTRKIRNRQRRAA